MDLVPQLPLDIGLDPGASFESYYAGANAQAVAAVAALARGDGDGFVYLQGEAGLGKTHLLQAACRSASEAGAAAAYLPLAQARSWSPEVLEGLEAMAVVALDDLEAVAELPEWQEALFHFYNRLRDAGGRLLVAARARPAELGYTLPDLVSRLQWGLLLRLQDLSDADKLQSLQLRARQRGLELPTETAQYLLVRAPRRLSALFALLDRLDEASLVAQRRLTIPFVKQVLE